MQQILFVHDFQESPLTRKNYLEMSGFEVTLLRNGKECLEQLARAKPALVLMDVLLEGPNGFEVCRSIRERCTAAEVPVVLCSHIYRSRIYRDEAVAAGAQRFLLLPLKLDDLLVHVMELVAKPSRAR
jgi:CheY-like chemotaxis protein